MVVAPVSGGRAPSPYAELLRRHILLRRLDEIRLKLRPYAESAGSLTHDEFFRDIS